MTDECIEWPGKRSTRGYGRMPGVRGGSPHADSYAHRFVWMLVNGPVPDGTVIRHSCDNPSCVNPRHLLAGSQKDNMQDMVDRDRWANNWSRLPVPEKCKNGHTVTPTGNDVGRRYRCKECNRAWQAAYRKRKKDQ